MFHSEFVSITEEIEIRLGTYYIKDDFLRWIFEEVFMIKSLNDVWTNSMNFSRILISLEEKCILLCHWFSTSFFHFLKSPIIIM